MSALTQETLKAIVGAIFVDQSTTMENAAREYSVSDLEAVSTIIYEKYQSIVQSLPDQAFTSQQPGNSGEEEWSAGEITGHLFEVNTESVERAGALAGVDIPPLPADQMALATKSVRSKEVTLKTVTAMQNQLRLSFQAILNGEPDLAATETTQVFDDMGVRGWLLFVSIHGRDHAHQLAKLIS